VTGALKFPTVTVATAPDGVVAGNVVLVSNRRVGEAVGAVGTALKILLTASSAACFSDWADGSFPWASDKNLFSVSSFRLAACKLLWAVFRALVEALQIEYCLSKALWALVKDDWRGLLLMGREARSELSLLISFCLLEIKPYWTVICLTIES